MASDSDESNGNIRRERREQPVEEVILDLAADKPNQLEYSERGKPKKRYICPNWAFLCWWVYTSIFIGVCFVGFVYLVSQVFRALYGTNL